MTYIPPVSISNGAIPSITDVNQVFENLKQLKILFEDRPYSRLRSVQTEAMTDATWTDVSWSYTDVNTNDLIALDSQLIEFDLETGTYWVKFHGSMRTRYRVYSNIMFYNVDDAIVEKASSGVYQGGSETADQETAHYWMWFELAVANGPKTYKVQKIADFGTSAHMGYNYKIDTLFQDRGYNSALLEIWKTS